MDLAGGVKCLEEDGKEVSRSWSPTEAMSAFMRKQQSATSCSQNHQLPDGSRPDDKLPPEATTKKTDTWTQVPLGNRSMHEDPVRVSTGISSFHHRLLLEGKMILDPYVLAVYNQIPQPQAPENGFSISFGTNTNVDNSIPSITKTRTHEGTSIPLAPETPNKCNLVTQNKCKGVQDEPPLQESRQADKTINVPDKEEFLLTVSGHGTSVPPSTMFSWLQSQIEIQNHENFGGCAVDFSRSNPVPLAPVTPDKNKQIPSNPDPVIIDLVDDSETEDLQVDGTVTVQQSTMEHNQMEKNLEIGDIDLNKTPQQKQRRKKHRPKVIREGGSARKKKQETPKSTGSMETPRVKRKYTRRKEAIASETPASGTGKMAEPPKKRGRKSAKRTLQFNSEVIVEEVRTHPPDIASQHNQGSNKHDQVVRSSSSCSQMTETAQQNQPGVAANASHSMQQGSNVNDTSLEIAMQAIQAARRAHLRDNLSKLTMRREGREGMRTSTDSQVSLPSAHPNSHLIPNGCSNSQRNHDCSADDQVNYKNLILGNPQMEKLCSDNQMLKKRKETEGGELAQESLCSTSSSYKNGEQINGPEKMQFISNNLPSDPNETNRSLPPKATQVCSFSSLISGISCGQLPLMSQMPSLQSLRQLPVVNTESHVPTSVAQTKFPRMHENKSGNPVNPAVAYGKYGVTSSGREDKSIECNAWLQGVPMQKAAQKGAPTIIHFDRSAQIAHHVSPSSGTKEPQPDILELIISKLSCLHIKDDGLVAATQEVAQNALVPYGGHGMIVPFDGLFDPSKKRKPRAKVDLDSETNRVWLLLMGKEGDLGAEGTDANKEKWWEEERRVFQGRVDSFIARMHLVQGDRRFSPWKGSVVDSVVGVFLTQNVSDHLSSSAFMAVAARFPARPRKIHLEAEAGKDIIKLQDDTGETEEISNQSIITQCPGICNQSEIIEESKVFHSSTSSAINDHVDQFSYPKSGPVDYPQTQRHMGTASLENMMQTPFTLGNGILTEEDDIRSINGAPSSQNSAISSQNSSDSSIPTADRVALLSDLNHTEDPLAKDQWAYSETYPSFMEMLQMAGTGRLDELFHFESGIGASNQSNDFEAGSGVLGNGGLEARTAWDGLYDLNYPNPSFNQSTFHHYQEKSDFTGASTVSYSHFNMEPSFWAAGMENMQPVASEFTSTNFVKASSTRSDTLAQDRTEINRQRLPIQSNNTSNSSDLNKNFKEPPNSLRAIHDECTMGNQQTDNQEPQSNKQASVASNLSSHHVNAAKLAPPMVSSCDAKCPHVKENEQHMSRKATESTSKNSINNNLEVPVPSERHGTKAKRGRVEKEKKSFDWDSLRRANVSSPTNKERSSDRMDSVDWEAVRHADVREISHIIRERGMNNMLAGRIKDFLDRLVREHGSIDLEWLRNVPPDQAKDYLLSIKGLGLKSVECVRLLTLHHLAFPVDTNVGRICVRLGWVPLQPLPESLQLHLLEMYPLLETIQKYLWPRLCKLDQKTLYELHYQMITFGKVFCTKSKPNCNACPMRGECKHFASAFASARLALPGPEEKRLVPTERPITNGSVSKPVIAPMPILQLEGNAVSHAPVMKNCEPIIEEPATPEPECLESLETDIEDAFYDDPDEIPLIKLDMEQFTQNLQNIVHGNMELQEGDMSKALVALTPEAASIPQPRLKNISRLRTEHQVYELPDSHPLLEALERREPDDPSPYLLAIWSPGETAQSTEPPDIACSFRENGKLCDKTTCFACNSIREAHSQKVRGTLLIPCRTAMRGSFPLNGTYFQVNEVFADHASSLNPIEVPRELIWNLPRRTVYFGTSVPTIFRGLTREGIQHCFWRGFVCVRGFEHETRAPRPLMARLHFPASKAIRNKRKPGKEDD